MSPSHFWYQRVGVAFVSSDFIVMTQLSSVHGYVQWLKFERWNCKICNFAHSLLREKWGSGSVCTGWFNYHSFYPHTLTTLFSLTNSNGSSKHPWPSSVRWIWLHIHQASPWQVQLQYLHQGSPWPSSHWLLWTALLWVLPQALVQEAEENMPTLPPKELQPHAQQSTETWNRWPWNSMHQARIGLSVGGRTEQFTNPPWLWQRLWICRGPVQQQVWGKDEAQRTESSFGATMPTTQDPMPVLPLWRHIPDNHQQALWWVSTLPTTLSQQVWYNWHKKSWHGQPPQQMWARASGMPISWSRVQGQCCA